MALPYNILSLRLQETLTQKSLPKYRHNTNWNLAFAWGEGKQHYPASIGMSRFTGEGEGLQGFVKGTEHLQLGLCVDLGD